MAQNKTPLQAVRDNKKPTELAPGWYRVRHKGWTLFREKRLGEAHMYNQRGYQQFYVSEYEILERVFLIPVKKGVKYV